MFLPYFLFLHDVEEGRDWPRNRRSDTILSSDGNTYTHARARALPTHTHANART